MEQHVAEIDERVTALIKGVKDGTKDIKTSITEVGTMLQAEAFVQTARSMNEAMQRESTAGH